MECSSPARSAPAPSHTPRPNHGEWRFPTALGPCRLRWSGDAVTGFALGAGDPAPDDAAPPTWVARLAARVQAHLAGHPEDFRDVPLDLGGLSPFAQRVLGALREVPPGRTVSYAGLAALAGAPSGAARAVGGVMARNPIPLLLPCHRVLASGGRPGGFSAPGGLETKRRLLAIEGAVPAYDTVSKRQGSCTRSR